MGCEDVMVRCEGVIKGVRYEGVTVGWEDVMVRYEGVTVGWRM